MAGEPAFTPAPANPQPLNFGGVNVHPSLDPIELLPAGVPQDRLRRLRQRSIDAHAIVPEFETIREASLARVDDERSRDALKSRRNGIGTDMANLLGSPP